MVSLMMEEAGVFSQRQPAYVSASVGVQSPVRLAPCARSLRRWQTLLIVLLLGTATTVSAQSPKRVALLVGNAAYESEKPLKNPVNDAEAIAAVLRNDLGFTEVKVLKNVRRRELVDAVVKFGDAARGADAAVFYFSGHGQQQNKANFLLPVDAKIDRAEHVKAEGIDADDVLAALEAAQPRVSLMILDACRDNPFAARTRSTAKGLVRPRNPEEGTLIAFATRDGDVAQDGAGNNSPYAAAIVQGLKQAGTVPIQQMFDGITDQVRQATSGNQRPTRYGDLKVNVYLINPTITINNGTSASARIDAEDESYAAAKAKNTRIGWEALLAAYPSGRYAAVAKIALVETPSVVFPPPPIRRQGDPAPGTPSPASSNTAALTIYRVSQFSGGAVDYQFQLKKDQVALDIGKISNGAFLAIKVPAGTWTIELLLRGEQRTSKVLQLESGKRYFLRAESQTGWIGSPTFTLVSTVETSAVEELSVLTSAGPMRIFAQDGSPSGSEN